jgi:hypothetical protein
VSAQVISFHHAKARHIAIAKAARVREIAEELQHFQAGEPRAYMAGYYEAMGWATDDEVQLALEALREEGR